MGSVALQRGESPLQDQRMPKLCPSSCDGPGGGPSQANRARFARKQADARNGGLPASMWVQFGKRKTTPRWRAPPEGGLAPLACISFSQAAPIAGHCPRVVQNGREIPPPDGTDRQVKAKGRNPLRHKEERPPRLVADPHLCREAPKWSATVRLRIGNPFFASRASRLLRAGRSGRELSFLWSSSGADPRSRTKERRNGGPSGVLSAEGGVLRREMPKERLRRRGGTLAGGSFRKRWRITPGNAERTAAAAGRDPDRGLILSQSPVSERQTPNFSSPSLRGRAAGRPGAP